MTKYGSQWFSCDFIWFLYDFIYLPFGPAATVPWTLGPGSRQTDKQQTRKPARQRANRPRNQQTKKPTRQQTNTTTSKKSRGEPPNQPKKKTKKSTKNQPKWLQNRSWRLSWAPLGASWSVLGPSWRQDGSKSQHESDPGKLRNGSW